MTTYLPTILICLVSFCTNYFKPFFFEAIVTVNLTSLLVLTTLFISVSNSLPNTSYVKMIDIWLIFVLCMPFLEVIKRRGKQTKPLPNKSMAPRIGLNPFLCRTTI